MMCQCSRCLLARLQGIGILLARGRVAMATMALRTVTTELATHVPASVPAAVEARVQRKPGRPAKVAPRSTKDRRARRLAQLLGDQPSLRTVAAQVLRIRPRDLEAIMTGRVTLSALRWSQLFAAVDPDGKEAA